MQIQALACPNCGGPLPLHQNKNSLMVCVYCDSVIRIADTSNQSAPHISVEKTISPDDSEHLKQLVISGEFETAIQLYQTATGSSPEDAEQAINSIMRQFSIGMLSRLPLSPMGWGFVVLYSVVLVAMIIFFAQDTLPRVITVFGGIFAAFNLLVVSFRLPLSLKYLRAPRAQATILHYVPLGELKVGRTPVLMFKAHVEVRPTHAGSFQGEFVLPVRKKSRDHLYPGTQIWVKYLAHDRQQIIFEKRAA